MKRFVTRLHENIVYHVLMRVSTAFGAKKPKSAEDHESTFTERLLAMDAAGAVQIDCSRPKAPPLDSQ